MGWVDVLILVAAGVSVFSSVLAVSAAFDAEAYRKSFRDLERAMTEWVLLAKQAAQDSVSARVAVEKLIESSPRGPVHGNGIPLVHGQVVDGGRSCRDVERRGPVVRSSGRPRHPSPVVEAQVAAARAAVRVAVALAAVAPEEAAAAPVVKAVAALAEAAEAAARVEAWAAAVVAVLAAAPEGVAEEVRSLLVSPLEREKNRTSSPEAGSRPSAKVRPV